MLGYLAIFQYVAEISRNVLYLWYMYISQTYREIYIAEREREREREREKERERERKRERKRQRGNA